MDIVADRTYRVVVRFPWGARREAEVTGLVREPDGTVRWPSSEALGVEPYMDNVIAEGDGWIHGWAGGCCDATAVISCVPGAPEP